MNATPDTSRHPLLDELGQRVRALRARRGMTRKALAAAARVSERHLANLEQGTGNASVLVLNQVAQALQSPLAELLGDPTTASPEWMLLRQLLVGRDEAALKRVRAAAASTLGESSNPEQQAQRLGRMALVGLRGAGKSTLGRQLAMALNCPFVELNHDIEQLAGCSVAEIQALYGMSAYRRYEHRALAAAIEAHPRCVLATPGGLVSDLASFELLLKHCTTVWLQASTSDHMARVVAQGDKRPMAASKEAMQDLERILEGRTPYYAKADFSLNTSAQSEAASLALLKHWATQLQTS
jgi:XRE family transcriptional regulator, aerobic/anaerobic benzoate catabolism transcriptional regulator